MFIKRFKKCLNFVEIYFIKVFCVTDFKLDIKILNSKWWLQYGNQRIWKNIRFWKIHFMKAICVTYYNFDIYIFKIKTADPIWRQKWLIFQNLFYWGILSYWFQIWYEKFKIQNRGSIMATNTFSNLSDFSKVHFISVFCKTYFKFDIIIFKFQMADPIWRPIYLKKKFLHSHRKK